MDRMSGKTRSNKGTPALSAIAPPLREATCPTMTVTKLPCGMRTSMPLMRKLRVGAGLSPPSSSSRSRSRCCKRGAPDGGAGGEEEVPESRQRPIRGQIRWTLTTGGGERSDEEWASRKGGRRAVPGASKGEEGPQLKNSFLA